MSSPMRIMNGLHIPHAALLAAFVLMWNAGQASAQFNNIFGNQPLRPPGGINEPIVESEEEDVPDLPVGPGRVLPSAPPPQGSRGPVQSQPLPPPPGQNQGQGAPPIANAPGNAVNPNAPNNLPAGRAQPGQPGQPPLAGLPPGQRQPRADAPNTPPPSPASLQPGDEVVVEPPSQKIINKRAAFSGLDKITGRIIAFDAAIGETVQFGALRITPRACYTRPPTETANTDGFIEVDEITLKGEVKRIYSGWMFAASPGLHAVEHSIYDVWLTDCKEPENAVAEIAPKVAPKAAQKPAPEQKRKPAAAAPAPQQKRTSPNPAAPSPFPRGPGQF